MGIVCDRLHGTAAYSPLLRNVDDGPFASLGKMWQRCDDFENHEEMLGNAGDYQSGLQNRNVRDGVACDFDIG